MKILISTGIYPPDIGGPATYSKLLFDELPKKGIDVSVLSFSSVRRYPKIIRHIFFVYKLYLASKDCDIIYAQDTVSVGLPSMIVSKVTRKIFFIRVPGDYAWEQACQRYGLTDSLEKFQSSTYTLRVELLRKIQKFVVQKARLIITPSNYFKIIVSKWVVNDTPVVCIYNGIDIESLKYKNNISIKKSKSIISSGRLVRNKGFDVLMDILEFLPEWKLYIAGDGPDKMRLINKSEKFKDRIIFLGQLENYDLMNYIKQCNVFVLNTQFETFSYQSIEAMALGVPVVASNVGGLQEIIINNESGILFEPNNIVQIVSSIKRLDEDDKFRNSIITNGLKRVNDFSLDKSMSLLANYIKKYE